MPGYLVIETCHHYLCFITLQPQGANREISQPPSAKRY